ncbi:IS1/IS1595 family N-terminal zinc-binding domain-containing protein, partial [Staphylococcus aureus]
CGSVKTKRNGSFRGVQRYKCRDCGVQFVHNTSVSSETLWHEFAHEHATVPVLAKRHGINERTVRRKLDLYTL